LLSQAIGGLPVMTSNFINVKTIQKRFKMITKNKTGKYSFLKYSLSVIAALSITLCFAVNSTPSEELKTVSFKGEITQEEALSERKAAEIDRELAKTEQHNLQSKLPEDVSLVANATITHEAEPMTAETKTSTLIDSVKIDEPYVIVEVMPEFPGGELALRKWIAENVNYPMATAEKGIQGKVYVTFVVEKDGSIGQAKITRSVDPSLDAEALRVTNSLPKWKPGRQSGKDVAVSYTIPINFVLDNGEKGAKINETTVVGYDKKEAAIKDSIYQECEVMPQFPGGELEIRKFIANNIRYPKEAMKYSEMGKVFVIFVVAKDGAVEKVRIARGISPALDNEAIRVVSSMPNWTPGTNKGEPVNVQYTIPVNFQLQ